MFLLFLLNINIFTRIIECETIKCDIKMKTEKKYYADKQEINMRIKFIGTEFSIRNREKIFALTTSKCTLKTYALDKRVCDSIIMGIFNFKTSTNQIKSLSGNIVDSNSVMIHENVVSFKMIANISHQEYIAIYIHENIECYDNIKTYITLPVEVVTSPKITRNSVTLEPVTVLGSSCLNFKLIKKYNDYKLRFKVSGYPKPSLFGNLTESQVGLSTKERWDEIQKKVILEVVIHLKEKIRRIDFIVGYEFKRYNKKHNKQMCINIEHKDIQLELTTSKEYYSPGDKAVFTITYNSIPGYLNPDIRLVRVNCYFDENFKVKREECQKKADIATINENTMDISNANYKTEEYKITSVFKKELITLTFNKLTLKDSFFYVESVFPKFSNLYEYSNVTNTWITAPMKFVNLPKITHKTDIFVPVSNDSSCFNFELYKKDKDHEITFKISGYPTPKLKIESTSIALQNGLKISGERPYIYYIIRSVQARLTFKENIKEIIIKASYDYPTYNKNNDKTICINIKYSDIDLVMTPSKSYYMSGDRAIFTLIFKQIPGLSQFPMKLIRANCLLNESVKVTMDDCQNKIEVATIFENDSIINIAADNGHYLNSAYSISFENNKGEIKLKFNQLTNDDTFFYVQMKIKNSNDYVYSNYVNTRITEPVEFVNIPKITHNFETFKSVTVLGSSCLNFILYKKYNEYELTFKISGYPTPKLKIESSSITLQNGLEISKESWDANHKKANVLARLILKQKVSSIIIKASYDYPQYNKNNDKTICINIEYTDVQLQMSSPRKYFLDGDEAIFTITFNTIPGLSNSPMKLVRVNCFLDEVLEYKKKDCQNKVELATIRKNTLKINIRADNGHYATNENKITAHFTGNEIKIKFNKLTKKDSFIYVEMTIPSNSDNYVHSNYINTRITERISNVTMDVYQDSTILDQLVSISDCKEYGVQVDSKVKVTCQGDGNQYPVIDMTMTNYKVKPGEIITKKVRIGQGIYRTVKSFSFISAVIKISCKYKYAYAEYDIRSEGKPTCALLKLEGFSSVSTILSGLFIGLVVFGILLFIMCNPLTKYIEKTYGIKLFKGKTIKGQKEDKMANKKLIQNYGAMPGGAMPGGAMPGGAMPGGKDKKEKGKKEKGKKGKDKKGKDKKGKGKKDKSKKKSKKNKKGKIADDTQANKGKIADDTQANKDDKTSKKGDITSNTGTIAVDTKSNKGKPSDDKKSNKGDLISNKGRKKKGKKGDKSKKRSKKNKKGKKGEKSRKRSKKHKKDDTQSNKGKIADDTQANIDDKKSNKGDKKSYKDEPYADDKKSNKGDKKSYKDEPYADEPYADDKTSNKAKLKKGKKKNKKGKSENDIQSNNDNQFEDNQFEDNQFEGKPENDIQSNNDNQFEETFDQY